MSVTPSVKTNTKPAFAKESTFLEIDEQTSADLEIFESSGGQSLFEFCNLTQTKGGERILRQRMEKPWAQAARIQATQQALGFIIERREQFRCLPTRFAAGGVESYLQAALPFASKNNRIEFTVEALSIWFNEESHYHSIAKGVVLTCKLIQTLTHFVNQIKCVLSAGELKSYLVDMQSLLAQPNLEKMGEEIDGFGVMKGLKIISRDHVFRMVERGTLFKLLELAYQIDALVAMAESTHVHQFVFPSIESGALAVHAEDLVHPYLPNAIPNPVALNPASRGLFLTGPNMAGKTTYLRAFALALYFAHLGMGVPATRFRFVPVEKLISSISVSDDFHKGISYFRAEAIRVKTIASAIAGGASVVAIMDEPFKGTNVKDTLEASLAILMRFSKRANFLFMFSSHQIELAFQLSSVGCSIDQRHFSAVESEKRLRFDYLLRPGVSSQRIGMRVLSEEGVFDVLDEHS